MRQLLFSGGVEKRQNGEDADAQLPQPRARPQAVPRREGPVRRPIRNRLAQRRHDDDESGYCSNC